jgi:hypothetical protein
MHWTEVVAILIIVAALIPVLVLFVYLGVFAWAGVKGWLASRRMDLGREYRCEHGVFVRTFDGWLGKVDVDGSELELDIRDEGGAPDAAFLRQLQSIVAKLPELERVARRAVPEITEEYILDSILSPVRPGEDHEFALGFSSDDEDLYKISIYVNFKGDQIIGWIGAD